MNQLPLKSVTCPVCAGASIYAPSNPYRPFCSERCKNLDWGAWASEALRLPAEAPLDDTPPVDSISKSFETRR